jgi:hypothetical protein
MSVRITGTMLRTTLRVARITRPTPEELAALREQVHLERRVPTPECLDELAVADFIDGALSGARRATVLSHVASCAHCRSVIKATAALVADESAALEVAAARGRSTRWASAVIGAAVAAAVIVFVALPRDHQPTLREPAVTSAIAPVALTPRGSVNVVDRFVWSRVPAAERYRLRLHRADGSVSWSAETTDSSVALPDSIRLVPHETYLWRVEALTEWRRSVESEMTQFRVDRAAP